MLSFALHEKHKHHLGKNIILYTMIVLDCTYEYNVKYISHMYWVTSYLDYGVYTHLKKPFKPGGSLS